MIQKRKNISVTEDLHKRLKKRAYKTNRPIAVIIDEWEKTAHEKKEAEA